MNLKTSYHYTYFVYPFLIAKDKYNDFLGKCIKDKSWCLNIHDSQVDLNTYAYFLPYVRKFLFPTLYWKSDFREQFENASFRKKLDIIANLSSVNFEYSIQKDYKDSYKLHNTGIDFEIDKIKLICFDPGISFLVFKTHLESSNGVSSYDILDFNYKFRTINPRYLKRKKTEGMFLSNSEFGDLEDLSIFIRDLLYGFEDVENESIYFDRLFTYSYMCLDEKEWNENRDLNEIINEFYKFQYVLPSNYGSTFDADFKGRKDNTYSRWKYSIYGFSRESGVVFSSSRESFNSSKLPYYYESMYFYIFLLAFYQRISLILFSEELLAERKSKIDDLKKRFTRFTHFSWFSQISNSEQGMDIWKKWQKAFDLPDLFDEVQKEYSEFYDYASTVGQGKINLLLILIYVVSVVFSGMTLMIDFNIIDTKSSGMKLLLESMLAITILIYPIYLSISTFKNWIFKYLDSKNN